MLFQIKDTFDDELIDEPFEADSQEEADATLGPVPRNEGFIIVQIEED